MFKKFTPKGDLSGQNQVKTSVVRGLKAAVIEIEPELLGEKGLADFLIPKKAPIMLAKTHSKGQIILHNSTPLFFQEREGPWAPTLRLLHQCKDENGSVYETTSGS